MCRRDEDNRLVKILNEVANVSHQINGHNHLVNGTLSKKQLEKLIDNNNIELNSLVNVQSSVEHKTLEGYRKVLIFDVHSQNNNIQNQSILSILPNLGMYIILFFYFHTF